MARRPSIPTTMQQKIMYDSAFACAVCQKRGRQIHHIDKNNANNVADNLVLLCQDHHDEAHSTHELSLNLNEKRLKAFKKQWCEEVRKTRASVASESGQKVRSDEFMKVGVSWGYINHHRLVRLASQSVLKGISPELWGRLTKEGIIDSKGIVVKPAGLNPTGNYIRNTIYDWFDFGDDIALHMFYSEMVDLFVESIEPIHLDDTNWKRSFIKEMIKPGSFIFINRGQYFKKVHETVDNAEIRVQAFKSKIRIRYQADTRHMFGTTSVTCSFSGHQTAASVLQVKSIGKEGDELILECTPIAMGVGFHWKTSDVLGITSQ